MMSYETLKVMERRLLKAIMTPAMIASWVFGIWLGVIQGYWSEPPLWLLGKLLLLLGLSATHVWLGVQVKLFAADANSRSAKVFRMANEVPTVLMIGIVILVVVKPFL